MKTINAVKYTIIAIVIAAASQASVAAQGKDGGGRLAGTWDTVVTVRNCATGNAITSFQSVGSFNHGGTFSGISSGMPPTLRTSERGVWSHVGANIYRFRFKAYLYNAAAVAIGYQVVTHDLELDEEALNWSSEGISQTFDMTDTQIGAGCSSAIASRMVLD